MLGITNVFQALTLRRPPRGKLQETLHVGQAQRVRHQARGMVLEVLGARQGRTQRERSLPNGRLQEALTPSQGWAQRVGHPLRMRPQELL